MTEIGRRLDANRGMPMLNHRRYETEWRAGIDGPISVDCPAAACVLVRRELCGRGRWTPTCRCSSTTPSCGGACAAEG